LHVTPQDLDALFADLEPRWRAMRFVVTGTDTDVGKTVFCAGLAGDAGRALLEAGAGGIPGDSEIVADWPGWKLCRKPIASNCRFAASGGGRRGDRIDPDSLVPPDGPVVIEGAGGLMVPLTRRRCFSMSLPAGGFP
jgi:dethiobiotin synthetase